MGIRGFNRPGDYGTRLLLLTDGARRNDPLYDQALLGNESPVEIDWVKRLEFVSGPASSIYGPNAVFGTANTVMLDGGDINGARISLDAGTHNTKRLGVVAGQRLPDDRDWFIGFAAYKSNGENLYFREYDDGTTNGRSRGLDGENYQKVYAKYRWGNWRLTGNFSQREKDVSPGDFIPIAEKSGLITQLGAWLLVRVCNDIAELRKLGIEITKVAINLSPRELRQGKQIVDDILDTLRRAGETIGRFQFEITENALIADNASEVLGIH